MEINSDNRNANILRRYCALCRRPGHNINNCDNERLRDFARLCRYNIELSIRYYNYPRQRMLDWLLNYSLQNRNLLNAFASSYLSINIRSWNIIDITHQIHNYYCVRYSIPYERDIQNEDLFINIEREHFEIDNLEVSILLNSIERLNSENNKKFNITTKIIENLDYFEKQNECFICYEEKKFKNFIKLNCNHEFCNDCIKNLIKNTKTHNIYCALCRSIVDNIEIRDNEILKEINNELIPKIYKIY